MENIATIEFPDSIARDDTVIFLRAGSGQVAFGISRKAHADVEVMIPLEKAQLLVRLLQEAVMIAKKPE